MAAYATHVLSALAAVFAAAFATALALWRRAAACASESEKACESLRAELAIQAKTAELDRESARLLVKAKEESIAKSVETLREQFANLAAGALKAQSGDLSKLNREQLDTVLKPLREQILRLQETAARAEADRSNLRRSISENVGAIGGIAEELSKTAGALASNTRVQGRRGEDILAEKLLQAGLERNVSFFLQDGTDTDRPDAQVCDTENRWLVIDSKVSLTAYLEYAAAGDDATRREKLAAHVASVRQKIDQLARKKYPQALAKEFPARNYLPVTAMFVPYEAPLLEALRADASLWQFAAQNNVVLVTPLTLLAYLRLVYLAWQHEKEARNQQDIVNTARELLARMNNFLVTFESLGRGIESLRDVYSGAKAVLVDAPHAQTIAKAANKLIDLHVRLESRKGRRLETAECLRREDADETAAQDETAI